MNTKRTKANLKAGAKMAAALAGVAGKKAATRLAKAGDAALIKLGDKLGEGARKRKRTRALKAVGKAALMAAATVLAGRAIIKKRSGK